VETCWERGGREGCDVVVVATRVPCVWTHNVFAAECFGILTSRIHSSVDAQVLRVGDGSNISTCLDFFETLGNRLYHAIVDGLVHGLDSIPVLAERLRRVVRVLDVTVNTSRDNHKGVKMEDDAVISVQCAILDTLVLLFPEGHHGWAVTTTVRLRRQADARVVGEIVRKFAEPTLQEVPSSDCAVDAAECGVVGLTTRECASQESRVLFGNWSGVVQECDSTSYEVPGDVLQSVIGEADLDRLQRCNYEVSLYLTCSSYM
jgi:hypothetical protein